MANVEEKQPVIDEIAELVKDAATVVLVDYRGLTVAEDTDLRRQLREADVTYRVYKNSMINFAIKDTEFADLTQHLAGPTAIAVCKEDATAAARILAKFAKDAEALEIKGGIVEGAYYDATTIGEIASIPSKDELLSKFLGSIQSPITDFARVLKQIADKDGEEDAAEEAAPAEEAAEEAPSEEASTEEEATEEEAPAEEEATEEEAPAEEEATEEEAPAEEEATEEEAPAEEEATEEEAPAEEEAAEEAPEEEAEEAPADDAE
ncbi:MAG: 50S ribosomal protein L10 [Eubacterium sp.]|nr:50S ribosomal protein L10 [Eubacterium sp.]